MPAPSADRRCVCCLSPPLAEGGLFPVVAGAAVVVEAALAWVVEPDAPPPEDVALPDVASDPVVDVEEDVDVLLFAVLLLLVDVEVLGLVEFEVAVL